MANYKRSLKLAFHLLAFILVVWGIYHTVRGSARELGLMRTELNTQANELLETAARSDDAKLAAELRAEAERLKKQAREFWKADLSDLLLAGLCYAVAMLPAAFFWRTCLFALGQKAPTISVLWAYFYGNLGKYFPGKAMVIVLRLAALEKFGIKRIATSITIFIETLTMMAVGGAVAAICLILLNIDWKFTGLALALLATTFLPTFPPLLRILLPRLQKGVDEQTLADWTSRIHWRLIASGWLMLTVTWIGFGLSLMLVLKSLPSADLGAASPMTLLLSVFGASALAVVLGFVSLIPGGAGVREVVLSTVLTPIVGPTAALCSALWVRIVWLAAELAMAALLAAIRTLKRERGGAMDTIHVENQCGEA